MKKGMIYPTTQIKVVLDLKGESIEEMLRRMQDAHEPIQANAKLAYYDRKEGVLPFNDIRTDRFDYALQATNKMHASTYAQRMQADGFMQNDKGEWVQVPQQPVGEA